MAVYPDSFKIEYYNGTSWVDISAYVVSDINSFSGFASDKPDDRVATLGILNLQLNNVDKLFTPYGGDSVRGLDTLTGFNKGAKVRVSIVINDLPKVLWTGFIDSITSDDGTWGTRRVDITCVDWMDVASRFPMKAAAIQTNKRIDEALTTALARLSIQPEDTDFDIGTETFPAVFSNVKGKTKAISEFNKLALSELGRIYLESDGTLRIENSFGRSGTRDLAEVPVHPDLLENLLLNDGTDFLLNNGETLLLSDYENDYETASLEFSAESLDIELKDEIINAAFVRAYPTRTATSLEVVFNLGSPIGIASGQTITFTGQYTNPNGGSPISATNQQTPVATTDYLMNTASDGSGTNITANLTVTATYYGDLVEYALTNTYTSLGYVTKLQARGYGIYYDSPVESNLSDEDSISAYGDTVVELEQKYKKDFYAGAAFGKSIIELYKNPKSRVKKATFNGNINHSHLMACSYLEVGNLVEIYDNRSEMSKWYYILSKKILLSLTGVLAVTFGLLEFPSIKSGGLNPVGVEFTYGSTDAINFGYIPQASNLTHRTYSAWVKRSSSDSPNIAGMIIAQLTDYAGVGIFVGTGNTKLNIQIKCAAQGQWETATGLLPFDGNWHHIVVTIDTSTVTPTAYIDGVNKTLTESIAHSGAVKDETGVPLVIGNELTATIPMNLPFNGKIKDVRIYNQILTSAEITELYNSGSQDYDLVTDGLVFQAFTINSDLGDATTLNGQQIPDGNNYLDNVLRMVGEPNSTPTISG